VGVAVQLAELPHARDSVLLHGEPTGIGFSQRANVELQWSGEVQLPLEHGMYRPPRSTQVVGQVLVGSPHVPVTQSRLVSQRPPSATRGVHGSPQLTLERAVQVGIAAESEARQATEASRLYATPPFSTERAISTQIQARWSSQAATLTAWPKQLVRYKQSWWMSS
jgi:hypothetical protein